jgi:hypothetical protein
MSSGRQDLVDLTDLSGGMRVPLEEGLGHEPC